jgi:hypothetical protein
MILAIGHGEYMPADGTYALLWEPSRLDWTAGDPTPEAIRDAGGDPGWFDYPDDALWHWVVEIPGLAALSAYYSLRDAVCGTVPRGDDDTFDYWPSGVRALRKIAAEIGPATVAQAERSIQAALALIPFTAEELGL